MFISYNQIRKQIYKKQKNKKIKLKNMPKYLGTELVNTKLHFKGIEFDTVKTLIVNLAKQFSINVTNTVNNFFPN